MSVEPSPALTHVRALGRRAAAERLGQPGEEGRMSWAVTTAGAPVSRDERGADGLGDALVQLVGDDRRGCRTP